MSRRTRSFMLAAVAACFLGGLVGQAEAFGCYRGGFGYRGTYFGGATYHSASYIPAFGAAYYPTFYPAAPELSDEDKYEGSKQKGDRMMGRSQFSKAAAEYANAKRRARRAWGAKSRQAKEAERLRRQARDLFARYGNAPRGMDYSRAKEKGDAAFDRGKYDRAIRQYEDALKKAFTKEQAKEASALVVRARDYKAGRRRPSATRRTPQTLIQRGDVAMASGRFGQAIENYATALSSAIREHGAGSAQVRQLTDKLTRAQRRAQGGAQAD